MIRRLLTLCVLLLVGIQIRGATVGTGDFNTNQFAITGLSKVSLRDGILLTNVTINTISVSNLTFNTFTILGDGTNSTTYHFPLTNCLSGQFLAVATNGNELYFYCTNLPTSTVVFDTIEELVATPIPLPGIGLLAYVRDPLRGGPLAFYPQSVDVTNRFDTYPSTDGPGNWKRPPDPNVYPQHGVVTGDVVTNDTLVAALVLQSARATGKVVYSGADEFLATDAVPILDNNKILFEDGAQATGLSLSGNVKTNIAIYGGNFIAAVGSTAVPALSLTNVTATIQSSRFAGYTGETIHTSGVSDGIQIMDEKGRLNTARAFGAVEDGVADDTQAIQYAINFSAANRRPLYIGEGTLFSPTLLTNLNNTFIRMENLGHASPPLRGNLGTNFVMQYSEPNSPLALRTFIHRQNTDVPENEFTVEAFYHPAFTVDNINPDPFSVGTDSAHMVSFCFRNRGITHWLLNTLPNAAQNDIDFAIREFDATTSPPAAPGIVDATRFKLYADDTLEYGDGAVEKAFINGNLRVIGFVKSEAGNETTGRAALALRSFGGTETFIRLNGDNRTLEIASARDGGALLWTIDQDGNFRFDNGNMKIKALADVMVMLTTNSVYTNNFFIKQEATDSTRFGIYFDEIADLGLGTVRQVFSYGNYDHTGYLRIQGQNYTNGRPALNLLSAGGTETSIRLNGDNRNLEIATGRDGGTTLWSIKQDGYLRFENGDLSLQSSSGVINVGSNLVVNPFGDITTLRGIPTSFPGTNAVGVLSNDGSGNMDWLPGGATGPWTADAVTNATLPGVASADGAIITNTVTAGGGLATMGAASSQGFFQGNNSGDALQPTFSFGSQDGYYHIANTHVWAEDGTQIARLIYNNSPFTGAGALSLGAGAIYFGGSPLAFTNSISSGYGTPEGSLAQPEGSLYLDRTSAGGKAWIKATGTGNTGWSALGASSGDFVGPASSTDNAIVRHDGTTGKLGQNSVVAISDAGAVTGVASLAVTNGVTAGTFNGNTLTTGSSTYTGTAAQTYTFPTTSATIARTDSGQTFTGDQTLSNQLRISNGTASEPSIVLASDDDGTGTGLFRWGADAIGISIAGTQWAGFSITGLYLHPSVAAQWNFDTYIYRGGAAATVELGADAATATAQTLKAHDGLGTDKAGADMTIAGGQGTGTGTAGRVKVKSSIVSTTGSSANAYTTAVAVGGTLKVDSTTTGNVGAGEDNLITYSVPAGQLAINGDHLEFDAFGTFAANANTKRVKAVFGATTLIDSTALIFNGIAWRIHGKVIRTGAATQVATAELTIGGVLLSATATTIASTSSPAETLSGAITFKCTGEDSGGIPANDAVVQNGLVLKWGANN